MSRSTMHDQAEANDEWDELMATGKQHRQNAQWEYALRAYNSAMRLCIAPPKNDTNRKRRQRVLKDLAYVNRCMGRYIRARELLEELLLELEPGDELRMNTIGDLGIVYQQLDQLEAARDAFQEQYELADRVQDEQRLCRAVGNLGMMNYQLSQANQDENLLELAAKQLQERVERAQKMRDAAGPLPEGKYDYPGTLKAIGLSRLSLCHSARGENDLAITTALESLELARPTTDSAVEAISRFFYGRALFRADQREEALKQFDLPKDCSPAVAFCKEPSREHCQYLQELLDAGAEMDTPDKPMGYTALDYAVFNESQAAESIVLKFLERKISGQVSDSNEIVRLVAQRRQESQLRKYYREIFQDRMRPILLSSRPDALHEVRQAYAEALASDLKVAQSLDRLKYVKYPDFVSFGKFPRSSDGLTHAFSPSDDANQHIIFISYRWVNRDPWARYPDNAENLQYMRILAAISAYLTAHPTISAEDLGIWIDFACIDQDDPMPGISALPMIIAQCNALISLVDGEYHDRAWCSVEVMMVQALRQAYGAHQWYEHIEVNGEFALRSGPEGLKAHPVGKSLSFERDREKVIFLERQCRLLC